MAEACYQRGLVTITAGTYGNVMRTLMPLVITDAELEEGLDVLEAALSESVMASGDVPGLPDGARRA